MSIKVSIVCTCYNSSRFISESIKSILHQSYKDWELILIDDGSTDNTSEIIKKLCSENFNIVFLSNDINRGIFYSRNKAFKECSGKYIAIHDSDDISFYNRIEKQVNFMENNPAIEVCGGYAVKIGEHGQVLGSMVYPPIDTIGAYRVITMFELNPIIDPSCMIKKESVYSYGGYNLDEKYKYAADFELWCRMLCGGSHMANIPEFLIYYRKNFSGSTETKKVEMRQQTDEIWASFKKRSFVNLPSWK